MRCRALYALLGAFLLLGCDPKPVPKPTPDNTLVYEVPKSVIPHPTPPAVQTSANDVTPPGAGKYKRDVISMSHQVWGLDAPIATFAAQIDQESGWNPDAKSPVGAQGLTQFMPKTAEWIGKEYPEELGSVDTLNPTWSIRALVRYDKYLYDKVTTPYPCDRTAFALSGYNGGLGWVYRDQKVAEGKGLDPTRYWGVVEQFNAGRSAAAFTENRGYPHRIIRIIQPRYATWGPMACADK